MHAQLSLWEERNAPGALPVWRTLDDEQRAAVVALLTRLIVKLIVAVDGTQTPHE